MDKQHNLWLGGLRGEGLRLLHWAVGFSVLLEPVSRIHLKVQDDRMEHLCLCCLLKPGSLHYYHCQGWQGSELTLQPFLLAYLSVSSPCPSCPPLLPHGPVPPCPLCLSCTHASCASLLHEGIQSTMSTQSQSLWVQDLGVGVLTSSFLTLTFCSVDFVSSAPQAVPALP